VSWQPIDFQRLVSLDKTLVEQLQNYLTEKEMELGQALLRAIPLSSASVAPVLPPDQAGMLKIADAVEGFGKKLRLMLRNDHQGCCFDLYKEIVTAVNSAFWEYDEVLEGCVKELFQQLEQLGIEQWNPDLSQVLDAIKDLLVHQIEDLIWAAKRIESPLCEFRLACETRGGLWPFVTQAMTYWKPSVDRSLLSNLQKSEKYLRIHHRRFAKRFAEYVSLDQKVKQKMKKLRHYEVLNSLMESDKDKFKKIYYFVKLWQYNHKARLIPVQELIRALNHAISVDSSIQLFQSYANALGRQVFHHSRILKKSSIRYFKDAAGKKKIRELMKNYHAEILSLGMTIGKYREFLLRTDPNPYIRSRWGFSEWIVGPEPDQTKRLLNIEFEVETLEGLLEKIEESIEKGPKKKNYSPIPIDPEIQRVLHEMGQPLTSINMTRARAEIVLKFLEELDELGSFNPYVIQFAGQIFSKVLRADWKHHVIHEFPLFHDLFKIHMGLAGKIEDVKHTNRMNKFKHLIQEIELWVKNRETRLHEKDIELDMNDLKGYLQDFLAQVQHLSKDQTLDANRAKLALQDIAQQLLIYRYIFGEFFFFLGRYGTDGKRIRNKLLFVDQYFESVENKIHELRNQPWPTPKLKKDDEEKKS